MAYSTPSYRPYKRTVRCSYCGGAGHNRAGCSDYKERIETLRKEFGDDHYNVRLYDQKKASKALRKSQSVRVCSYCQEGGHNRATCQSLKGHIAETIKQNAAFRQSLYDCLAAANFGLGSIVTNGRWTLAVSESETYNVPQVVTRVNWSALNYWNDVYSFHNDDTAPFFMKPIHNLQQARPIRGSWIKDATLMSLVFGSVSSEWFDSDNWRSKDIDYYFSTIVSGVPSLTPPPSWFDGGTAKEMKAIYKARERLSWQGAL